MARSSIQIITIITPSYERVGREMVRRVKRFTGHDVKVVECPDSEGFRMKLNLDKLAGRRKIIWMDCDMWPLREWTPEDIHLGDCIQACWDHAVLQPHSFCYKDCHEHGLPWEKYANSGLVCWNNANPDHRDLFKVARKSWSDQRKGKKTYVDVTDQGHISFAINELGLPLQFLPESYNCYLAGIFWGQRPYVPREIINLHGAGIPAKKKYNRMKTQASVFGVNVLPITQEAVNWEHAKLFHMR